MLFIQHLLRTTSYISIGVECSIMLLVVLYSQAYSLQDNDVVPFRDVPEERLGYFVGPSVFSGVSTFSFTFVGTHASFEVCRSLKEPTYSNWKTVVNYSVVIAGVLNIMVGVSSWLNLGDGIAGNIMDSFSPHDAPTLVGKVLLAITMNLTYPMDFFVARQNINQCIFVGLLRKDEYMPLCRLTFITLSIWMATLTLGKCTAPSLHYFLIAMTFFLFFLQGFCLMI